MVLLRARNSINKQPGFTDKVGGKIAAWGSAVHLSAQKDEILRAYVDRTIVGSGWYKAKFIQ
jgi:hypothetical protein